MLTKIRSAVANTLSKSRRAIQSLGLHLWTISLRQPLWVALRGVILKSWYRCSRKATYITRMASLVFLKMIRRVWRWHWTPRSRFIALSVKGDKTWCIRARIPRTQLRRAWGKRRHGPLHRWVAQKWTSKLELQTSNWTYRALAPLRQN